MPAPQMMTENNPNGGSNNPIDSTHNNGKLGSGWGRVGLQMMTQRPAPATPASDDHVCIAANNTLYRC